MSMREIALRPESEVMTARGRYRSERKTSGQGTDFSSVLFFRREKKRRRESGLSRGILIFGRKGEKLSVCLVQTCYDLHSAFPRVVCGGALRRVPSPPLLAFDDVELRRRERDKKESGAKSVLESLIII